MMKKLLSIIFFLIINFSFSQTETDDYEIFTEIINKELKSNNKIKANSVIVIKDFDESFDKLSHIYLAYKDSTFHGHEEYLIKRNTDSLFLKRYHNEPNFKSVILGLIDNFNNHPIINKKQLKQTDVPVKLVNQAEYTSFFKKSYSEIDKGWRKFKNKYHTPFVFEFSKVHYTGDIAAIYSQKRCEFKCGSGDVTLLEKVNNKWMILAEINLYIL